MFSKKVTKDVATRVQGRDAIAKKMYKVQMAVTGLMMTVMMTGMPISVFASSGGGDGTGQVREVLDLVTLVFPLIGAPLALSGAFKLFMAYRGGQSEDMGAAGKDLAIGIVMVLFRALLWPQLANIII